MNASVNAKVCVIIATHRRADLLRRAVLSVLQQSCPCYQVIVVSDVEDGAAYTAVVDLLRDQDYFVQRAGIAGPAESRNLALKLVTADYFVFLDDDDTFGPEFLAQVSPALSAPETDGRSLIYTNFDVINEYPRPDGDFDIESQPVDIGGYDITTAQVKNFIPNNCVLYPSFLATTIRFDPVIAYEDWDFLLSALKHVPARHVALTGPKIHKRQVEGWEQRGNKNNDKLLECYLKIYAKHPPTNEVIGSWRQAFFKTVGVDIAALVNNQVAGASPDVNGTTKEDAREGLGSFDALNARTVFVFWLGPYVMSSARTAAVHSIFRDVGTPVCFITDATLKLWELPESPFHEGIQYLSEVHRADYLRCYLMHHYGGGYTDVKPVMNPWNKHFDELLSSDALALGYPEISASAVAQLPGEIGDQLRSHYSELIGYCSMIFKRQTSLTKEWFDATHLKLDILLPLLKSHPAQHPMDQIGVTLPNGAVSSYPLRWTELGGNIFHPIILKYRNDVLKRESIKPQLHNYR